MLVNCIDFIFITYPVSYTQSRVKFCLCPMDSRTSASIASALIASALAAGAPAASVPVAADADIPVRIRDGPNLIEVQPMHTFSKLREKELSRCVPRAPRNSRWNYWHKTGKMRFYRATLPKPDTRFVAPTISVEESEWIQMSTARVAEAIRLILLEISFDFIINSHRDWMYYSLIGPTYVSKSGEPLDTQFEFSETMEVRDDNDPVKTALRCLREEAGLVVNELRYLKVGCEAKVYSPDGVLKKHCYYYFVDAENLRPFCPTADELAQINTIGPKTSGNNKRYGEHGEIFSASVIICGDTKVCLDVMKTIRHRMWHTESERKEAHTIGMLTCVPLCGVTLSRPVAHHSTSGGLHILEHYDVRDHAVTFASRPPVHEPIGDHPEDKRGERRQRIAASSSM